MSIPPLDTVPQQMAYFSECIKRRAPGADIDIIGGRFNCKDMQWKFEAFVDGLEAGRMEVTRGR